MAAHTPLLTVEGLSKSFGGVTAVRDVSFDVRRGQMVALIGSNGAGKTTAFNCINGQLRANGGRVLYNAAALTTRQRVALEESGEIEKTAAKVHDITGRPPRRIARLGIARTFQITATFASMTASENVQTALIAREGAWRRLWGRADAYKRAEALRLLDTVGLADQAGRDAATMAYGDLKKLEMAMALAGGPKLLLMDEPTAGMGISERDALMAMTRRIARDHNVGILFTEHDMSAVFGYADWVIVMHRGAIIAHGTAAQIKNDAVVRSVYLGEEQHHA